MKNIYLKGVLTALILAGLCTANTYAYDGPGILQSMNIIQGRGETKDLALDQPINRAELMKVIVDSVLAGSPDVALNSNCFTDVTNEWFAKYVCFGAFHGYVSGYPDGNFHAGKLVTHAEALKIVNEVFALGAEKYQTSSTNLWYIPYYKNAVAYNLLSADSLRTSDDFSKPITRGEVFEYIARALATSESSREDFSSELYDALRLKSLSVNTMNTLTEDEKLFLKVLKNQIDYGYSPQTSSGSMMFDMSGTDFGTPIALGFQGTVNTKVSGSTESLDGEEVTASLLLKFDGPISIFGSTDTANVDERVQFIIRVGLTAQYKAGSAVYVRLDDFKIVEAKANVVIRAGLYEIETQAQKFKGVWYSWDIPADVKAIMGNGLTPNEMKASASFVRLLEVAMAKTPAPIFDIVSTTNGDDIVLSISLNPDSLSELILSIMESTDPTQFRNTNTYELRNSLKRNMTVVRDVLHKLHLALTTKQSDQKIYSLNSGLDVYTFVPEPNSTVNLSFDAKNSMSYPTEVIIKFPTESLPLQSLFDAFTAGAMVNDWNVLKFVKNMGTYGASTQSDLRPAYIKVLDNLLN